MAQELEPHTTTGATRGHQDVLRVRHPANACHSIDDQAAEVRSPAALRAGPPGASRPVTDKLPRSLGRNAAGDSVRRATGVRRQEAGLSRPGGA